MKPIMTVLGVMAMLTTSAVAAASPFAEGLQFPQRLVFTPLGSLLVSEGGTAQPNTGRVSIVNRQGNRRSLLEGLPAASGHGIPAFGPTGMALNGRTLYLLIGEGDVNVGPPFVVNVDGPSTPIFSSVLQIQFSTNVDVIDSTFTLSLNDHWTLIDGYDLDLRNVSGDRARVHLLTAFRPLVRNIMGGLGRARPSDPYGTWLDASNNALYIADASSETLVKVDTITGRYLVLTRFQSDERITPTGPVFVDTVPTALCQVGDSFLVSFLSGAPYLQGASSVKIWNPSDGRWSRPAAIISDLTMTTDMVCVRGGIGGIPRVVTVEYTVTPPPNNTSPLGRVQLFEGSRKTVLMQDLILPTAITQDPISGDLFVSTLPGLIFRVPLL